MLIHIAFYWGMTVAISRFATRDENSDGLSHHPLIKRAFELVRYYWVACAGTAFAFSYAENGRFIYPVIFIFMGLLFGLYSRFSTKTVAAVAWSYVVVGCGLIALTKFPEWRQLWMACMAYQGLSFMVMGFDLHRERAKRKARLA